MKYFLILIIIPFLSASECGQHKNNTVSKEGEASDSLPACVQKLINSGNKEIPDAPLEVDEYSYKGKRTFLFTAQCCDQFNVLYDDSCKAICAPSGGFTGKGDRKCEDFSETATHVKLIWKKPSK